MKLSELIGSRVRVVVHATPCRISMDGVIPLYRTTWATVDGGMAAPYGPVIFARDDGGNRIGIDSNDISAGRVEIELPAEKEGAEG